MSVVTIIGIIGSLILVTGAAWPEKKGEKPIISLKSWLFAVGGFCMLLFSVLDYLNGGIIFFVLLQLLVAVSTVLMMLNVRDGVDAVVIGVSGAALVTWSLFLFEGISTLFFILGLVGIGLGYAFGVGTVRRNLALTIGSALVALFSYIEANWIFFWLNVFFALFSAWYLYKKVRQRKVAQAPVV